MDAGHVTTETLGRLRRRELAPDRIAEVLRHLSGCADCRALAAREGETDADALQTMLARGREPLPEHRDSSELAAYVDGALEPAEREIVESHLDDCAVCRAEVDDLQAMRRVRPRPRRWRMVTTAAAAAAVAIVLLLQRGDDAPAPPTHPPTATRVATTTTPPTATATTGREPRRYANPEWARLVATAAATGTLPFPRDLHLLEPPDALRGTAPSPGQTLSPSGIVVDTTRPRFTWPGRAAATYVVSVFDGDEEIANSGPLTGLHWTPARPLPRGRTYLWQVTATRDGKREILPAPPAPAATFRITSQRDHEELAEARRLHPNDHLLHAVLAARAGLRTEAMQAMGRVGG